MLGLSLKTGALRTALWVDFVFVFVFVFVCFFVIERELSFIVERDGGSARNRS